MEDWREVPDLMQAPQHVALGADDPPRRRRRAGTLASAVGALGLLILATQGGVAATTSIGSGNAVPALATTTTAARAPSTTALVTTTAVAPTSTTTAPVSTTVAVPDFCPLAVAYVEDLRQIAVSLTDPAQVRALAARAGPAIAKSGASVPAEIKADVALLATAIAQYTTALDKAGYVLAKLSPDMVIKLQTPAVQNAITHVDNYVRKACGAS